ncbi:phosphotransferase enzyme family protein [Bradyrhizobium sp. CCGUVB23]|uniref:phosphotransferase enzyme family protein n=1 Tax=Bradyrhizobium sp. CCGUVB23 TaxID=2949630 RepID=UPI0020B2FD15|nr:phosphotransferase [Bradyrhizobium sp. CCGUVB23]MCP3466231.1 phosphotransferase [Bradyrhizobium sp. CCGUVB23]
MVDFEPIYTISPAKAVARFLAERYALAAPLQCRMVRRGFNDTYRIVTASDERYIFRLSHHRARGAADVGTETDFLAHLARSGVPVAAAVRTPDGALFVRAQAREGQREGVLFHELQGRAPEATSLADARANGVTLAKLHNAADSYSAPAPLYRLDLDHLLRRPLARIRKSGLLEDASAEAADLEAIATRTTERIEAHNELTWTHCHGDCHGSNAFITEAGEADFFDFDDGGPGYLAYDLSVFLWAKVSFGRKLHAVWHAFVDGYRSVRPITQSDFEAAHAFVIVRHFWLMGEYASRTREWGTELTKWVAREGEFLRAWEREQLDGRLLL